MDVGTRLVGGPAENSARWSVGICLVTASGLCRRCPCVGMADAADWWILVVQKDSKHLVLEQNKLYLLYIYGIYLVLYIYTQYYVPLHAQKQSWQGGWTVVPKGKEAKKFSLCHASTWGLRFCGIQCLLPSYAHVCTAHAVRVWAMISSQHSSKHEIG